MPKSGEFFVPAGHWFIWPASANITTYASVTDARYFQFVRESSLISKTKYVGRPYERWFWRKQEVS